MGPPDYGQWEDPSKLAPKKRNVPGPQLTLTTIPDGINEYKIYEVTFDCIKILWYKSWITWQQWKT